MQGAACAAYEAVLVRGCSKLAADRLLLLRSSRVGKSPIVQERPLQETPIKIFLSGSKESGFWSCCLGWVPRGLLFRSVFAWDKRGCWAR